MNRVVAIAVCLTLALAGCAFGLTSRSTPDSYPYRLVFVQMNLTTERRVEDIGNIIRRASEHGYTGMVLSAGLDAIELKQPVYLERLKRIKKTCDDAGIDLVPLIFSAGYAFGTLAHDRNLAAAMPVRRVPFVMRNGKGVLVEDSAIGITNGGFESHSGHRISGFRWQDEAGELSFADAEVAKEGKTSLRFENVSESKGKMGRVIQTVAVRPFRCYRLSCWVKTDNLDPAEQFRIAVMTDDSRTLMTRHAQLESTQDWEEVSLAFNSLEYEAVNAYAGVWNGPSGRFWIDDMRITEVGFLNVLHRPGTPMSVRGDEANVAYKEGTDYERVEDDTLSFGDDHAGPLLKTLPGGRIGEGELLFADYYQALALEEGSWQMGVCLSEPRVYEIWRKVVEILDEHIAPKAYFLSMDEVRQGGWCEACTGRGLSAGELFGDCVTRQVELVRKACPDAEIFVWSDMLDPNHNAKESRYLFKGDFAGSWNHVPGDIIMACWYYGKRKQSLRHFDELSFRTIGCGYYDAGNLENAKGWLEALAKTAGACGIMYTTWRGRYDHLEPFGDLVASEDSKRKR